jgi:uncharacterized membrane protein
MTKQPKQPEYNPAERPRDLTDRAFRISLWGKFIDGVLETIGGILLLIITPQQISHLAQWLTQGELSENPHDFIANHILRTAHHLTGASLAFGAAYLLAHGLVKIILVIEVIRDHLWAYMGLIVVTAVFVVYQVYRITVKFSVSMLLLTLFDLLIIYLTQKEYRRQMDHRQPS